MSEPRHRSVDSFGLPIHCLEWGDPDSEPLVLVHGFLDLAFSWTALRRRVTTAQPQDRCGSSLPTAAAMAIAAGWATAAITIFPTTFSISIA